MANTKSAEKAARQAQKHRVRNIALRSRMRTAVRSVTAAIAGINTDATNLSSARSGIEDTDYAQATSQLSKAQILQQASTAMVAQANTVPQNVLTLLQKLP